MAEILRVTVCLAFAALPLFAQPPSSVGVFMLFDSVPGAGAVELMESEVEDLLKPAGLSLVWRLASENQGSETFAGLVVLKFKGRCKPDAWPQLPVSDFGSSGEVHELALTRVSNGRVLPYTEVECDEVRRALAYLGEGVGLDERQAALGRAMGRVVAHELYHILAKTTVHARRGLAKPAQSLGDLVAAKRLAFLDSDLLDIGRALNSQPVVPARLPSSNPPRTRPIQ